MQHNAAFHQGMHCLLRLKIKTNLEEQKKTPLYKRNQALASKIVKWTIPYLLYYHYVRGNPLKGKQ